jgi:hypothetical protein
MAKGGNSGGGGSTTLVITEFGEDTGTDASDRITYDNTITLTGTSTEPAGTIVTIYANGVNLGTATVLGSGDWTFTTTALADGIYDFTAQTGKGKTKQVSDPLTLTIDTTVPDAPTDLSVAGSLISGTAEAGATVQVWQGDTMIGSITATNGTWEFDVGNATGSFTAVATDTAGNTSLESSAVTISGGGTDTTTPTASAPDLLAGSDTGISATDNLTNDATSTFRFTLDGTVAVGDTIELLIDGVGNVTHVITAADVSAGSVDLTSTTLVDGTNTISARLFDAAGNESTTSSLNVIHDSVAPVVGTPDLDPVSDSGGSDSDNITADATPTITGTGEAGATITLYDGATVVGSGMVQANGTWSITSASLGDGAHDLTAIATDAAGNSSAPSVALSLTIDTTAPSAPAVTGVLMADGSTAPGGVTDDDTPQIRGTTEAGSTVEVFINGSSIGTAIADQNGNWSIIAAALLDAVYTVTAEATDAAGNTSVLSGRFQIEVDAVADPPPGPADPTGDPLYGDQWHLTMIGDLQTIWQEYSGAGVSVGVYDNGIEYTHPDLAANYDASKHVIVDGQALDPSPSGIVTAEHGTAVSGVIAAVDNDVGGVGVAFGASITGVNIFGGPADINGADISGFSQAIYQAWTFDIINNSWGATPDFNNETNAAMLAAFAGFEYAVQTGRGGLGTIVVKAAGNDWDSSQGDFLNASRYTITVAAHDQDGDASWYTNRGANVLVSAPSSGSSADGDAGILTTDETGGEGYAAGDYTYGFGGTSSATPVVAGVVALMLDANPNLGWRDVQSILAYSATKIGDVPGATAPVPADSDGDGVADTTVDFPIEFFDWFYNSASDWNGGGLHFSEDYGFGGVDAYAATRMAEVWSLFGAAQVSTNEQSFTGIMQSPALAFDNQWVEASYTYAGPQMELEYVEVYVSYTSGGGLMGLFGDMEDVSIELVSAEGSVVSLMQAASDYTGTNEFLNPLQGLESGGTVTWTFGVNAFRGEDLTGDWTVRIVDVANDFISDGGVLNSFQLTFYGAAPTTDDVYHYTAEMLTLGLAGDAGRTTLDDAGGDDWFDFSASGGTIFSDMSVGGTTTLNGVTIIETTGTTVIENAVSGDGNDTLLGNGVANQLYGMRGDDTLSGGAANDTLSGGAANDTLWGGIGDDLFLFYLGDGQDWIGDFTAGLDTEDVIALYGFSYDAFGDLVLTDLGGSTLINLGGGDGITLAGVAPGALAADDFLFDTVA